jgi:glycosyltransferase involved in cell wall biosynthesis
MRLLSLYRSSLYSTRGTPLRVKNIVDHLAGDDRIELYTATWDQDFENSKKHLYLDNNHWKDLFQLIKFVKKYRIEVLIGHTIASAYYLIPLKYLCRAKIMLEMHGFIEEEEYLYGSMSKMRYMIHKFFFNNLYRFFDSVTTCSETATMYISKYNKKVVTVYGGVDTNIFKPLSHKRNEANIVIGYAGNARKWQGLDFLLDVVKELHAQDPRFILRILISEKKYVLPEWAHSFASLEGPVSHEMVPAFLSTCDMLVIPRLQNTVNMLSFPSKLPEFMAMGIPIIASRTSDCHRIILDGTDGLLFNPGDAEGLVRNIRLLADPETRTKIGRASREKMVSQYGMKKQMDIIAAQLFALETKAAVQKDL